MNKNFKTDYERIVIAKKAIRLFHHVHGGTNDHSLLLPVITSYHAERKVKNEKFQILMNDCKYKGL